MDQLKIVTSLDGGYAQWWSALPQEDSGFRSLWVTADGYFYCLARKQMKVCSKLFTTPMHTIEARQSFHLISSQVVVTCARILTRPQAEVLKGDLYESEGISASAARWRSAVGGLGNRRTIGTSRWMATSSFLGWTVTELYVCKSSWVIV